MCQQIPETWQALDITRIENTPTKPNHSTNLPSVLRLPSYDQVAGDKRLYALASRLFHLETNPGNGLPLVHQHGKRDVWINPPPLSLTTKELGPLYAFAYTRQPHPAYKNQKIPAWKMIRFTVNIMRGCFGGL